MLEHLGSNFVIIDEDFGKDFNYAGNILPTDILVYDVIINKFFIATPQGGLIAFAGITFPEKKSSNFRTYSLYKVLSKTK